MDEDDDNEKHTYLINVKTIANINPNEHIPNLTEYLEGMSERPSIQDLRIGNNRLQQIFRRSDVILTIK